MRGTMIVFEGLDSSGKKTQTDLLEKKLKEKNHEVEMIDFPQYDSPFGQLVGKYLRGEFGSLGELPPEISALLYTADRYQFKDKIESFLKDNKVLIVNRYIQSNMAFQSAFMKSEEKTEKFIDWVKTVESRLPQADVVVFLDMPVEAVEFLMETRENRDYRKDMKKDIHEEDSTYQKKVRDSYLNVARREKNWVVVECAKKTTNGWKIRTPQEIHDDVWNRIDKFFAVYKYFY
ncbi:MAG: dTMP kinase [Candidatus Diapherotrites archaeon]|nr:dTMP kinase [Candidatus Diapherotrites archaeon]